MACVIGISIKNRPRLGIIHKPYSTFPYPGCERTYIGVPESGLFTIDTINYSSGERQSSKARYMQPFENGHNLNL